MRISPETMARIRQPIMDPERYARMGAAADPNIVIDTPFETWMDILTRKADGQRLFLEGKYRVTGDLNLMIQLFQQAENG